MNNHKPLSKKKTVRIVLALTILAWATQTFVRQLAHGQEIQPFIVTPDMAVDNGQDGGQKFVAGDAGIPCATLELRGEATVTGAEVKLKNICRWSSADAQTFSAISQLTIARLGDSAPFKSITVDQIRRTLHEAGINVATINFAGPTSCTVSRSDMSLDPHTALDNWINAQDHTAKAPATQPAAEAVVEAPRPATAPSREAEKPRTLQEILTADVCQRLNVPVDLMQITFNPDDEKVLALAEPFFRFGIDPSRMGNLGVAQWDVNIRTDAGSKKVSISARTRAWQNQVIVARPVAFKQLLVDDDFTDRRVLVDELPSEPLLRRDQCIGQQASRDLKPGTVMSARLVDPVPMVHSGELVTVTLTRGTMQIKSVARAMESGVYGQSIKVKNENTRDIFDVTMTGPQEAQLGGASPVASAGN